MSTPTTKIGKSSTTITEKKWLIPVLLGLVGILLFSNLFLLNLYTKKNQTVQSSSDLVKKMEMDSLKLHDNFVTALDSLNQKKTENKELNAYIDNMKEDLTKIYKEIGLKVKAGMSDESLNIELNRIKTRMRDNISEIDNLKKDKVALQQRIVQVQKEKETETGLKLSALSERDRTDSLKKVTEAELASVAAAKIAADAAKAESDNKIKALEVKFAEANFVTVPIMKVTPQNQRNRGAEETGKARKVDFYKVCFTTGVNPLVKKGNQKFYIRLLAPEGVPIQIGDSETMADGKPVRFTQLVEAEYDGTAKETCVNFTPKDKLKSGKYGLDIFNNDKLVGQTSFTLK